MPLQPYTKVTLAYLAFGSLWILTSDGVVSLVWQDADSVTRAQTLKGWLYVAATALLIHTLSRSVFRQQERGEAEKLEIFRKTIEGMHHILRNYLNQMQLVRIEASRCPGFDREVLSEADDITKRAIEEIDNLSALAYGASISGDNIEGVVYRDLCALDSERAARRKDDPPGKP